MRREQLGDAGPPWSYTAEAAVSFDPDPPFDWEARKAEWLAARRR